MPVVTVLHGVDQSGLAAAKPANANPGAIFYATDTKELWVWDSVDGWLLRGPAELSLLDGATSGSVGAVIAGKVVVAGAAKQISGLGTITLDDAKNIVGGTSTGTMIGTAIDQKLGFHGATPSAQRANASQAAVAMTGATSTSPFGFTEAQANGILTLLNETRASLVEKGIIKGAA